MAQTLEKARTRTRTRLYITPTEMQVKWMRLNIPHGMRSKLIQFLLHKFIELPKELRDRVMKEMIAYYNQLDEEELENESA